MTEQGHGSFVTRFVAASTVALLAAVGLAFSGAPVRAQLPPKPQAAKISAEFPFKSHLVSVLGSKMHYIDEGEDHPEVIGRAIADWRRRLLKAVDFQAQPKSTAASKLTTQEFIALMERLAHAWSEQHLEQALSCFTEDAVYMEPPDIQFYEGQAQLRPYFAALKPGTYMRFQNLWFDEARQAGAGEYSFGRAGRPTADHGVVVVEVRNGRIAFWREYQRKGPSAFKDFVGRKGKKWQWHIGNYP